MERQPVALVTGGSSPLGRAICTALAHEQLTVLINYDSNIGGAEQTREQIEQAGGRAELCQADITAPSHRGLLLDFCMENLGRLDLLVNNAGIAPPKHLDLLETTEANYDAVLRTNLKGPFFLTQAAARIMIRQLKEKEIPAATIINISSASAYAASVNRGEYCISKAGLSMITALFAARLGEFGIHVYEVRRGLIETDQAEPARKQGGQRIKEGLTPLKRWGRPEDVAKAVAMLARGDLPFSTGEVVNVDGGFHLRQL